MSKEDFSDWDIQQVPVDAETLKEQEMSPLARPPKKKGRPKKQVFSQRENLVSDDEVERIRKAITEAHGEIIPVEGFFEDTDRAAYYKALSLYLKDFEGEELSALDFDDIQTLALNKVWVLKLMSVSGNTAKEMAEASTSIAKYKQDSIKIKENLAVRRKDRIDPRAKNTVTILDLASQFDETYRRERTSLYNQDDEEREVFRTKQKAARRAVAEEPDEKDGI